MYIYRRIHIIYIFLLVVFPIPQLYILSIAQFPRQSLATTYILEGKEMLD